MGPIESELSQALNKLGHTSLDVAHALENKGVKGTCGCADTCAIAEYLLEQFPGYTFAVSQSFISMWELNEDGSPVADSRRVLATVPEPVSTFITQFDANKFPNLIKESA